MGRHEGQSPENYGSDTQECDQNHDGEGLLNYEVDVSPTDRRGRQVAAARAHGLTLSAS
jgi:hypothetical protein